MFYENETKRNETKRNEKKQNEAKQNEAKTKMFGENVFWFWRGVCVN
jgi:hypothetical protein